MRLITVIIPFVLVPTAIFSQQQENVSRRYIAFTFDDLPATHERHSKYIIEHLTKKLMRHGVPATGFVNEVKLYDGEKPSQRRIALLKHWLDCGLDLGNHSYSHISIDKATLAEYKADVLRGEKITKALLAERNRKIKYYRHTQLRTGPTPEIRKDLTEFLAAHGYTVAPVTIDNNEYVFADLYERATANRDTAMIKVVVDEYLQYMEKIVKHFEKLSMDFLGYEVKQILLLHANRLNADYLDELIQMFQDRNYAWISLDEALEDPAYQLEEVAVKKGLSWLHRWMLAKGLALQEEPKESERIDELFKSYR